MWQIKSHRGVCVGWPLPTVDVAVLPIDPMGVAADEFSDAAGGVRRAGGADTEAGFPGAADAPSARRRAAGTG